MDLSWLWQEIVANRIIVALTSVGSAVLGVVKKHWSSTMTPVLYGVVGVGIVIFWISLQYQSERVIEALERIGNEQTEALSKLANDRPTRPYFTQAQAAIQNASENLRYLTVSVQNNDHPAENVVSHLLVLEGSLDASIGPLHSNRVENANPVGSGGIFSHHWAVRVPPDARPAFVVFQVRYTNALSNETYSQALFFKFTGTLRDGTFVEQLFGATSDDKNKIERYMEQRGISKL